MNYDVIVVGAGIVGLASALKILEKKPSLNLLLVEKENEIAKHQTGNNSGVIHSGIYYKPGSLKANNCTSGYKMLLDFCNKNEVEYNICGKVIIAASSSEIISMKNIFDRGVSNGLSGIKLLTKEEVNEIEPHTNCLSGIFVPQTGIIDYSLVAKKYLDVVCNYGGKIKYNCKVEDISVKNNSCEVITDKETYSSKVVVTCAGLHSDRMAKMTHKNLPFRLIPFRGEYYKLKDEKKYLVKNLIYPIPDPAFPFLGVHFTRVINGQVECGPNAVLSFKREGYKKTSFNMRDTVDTFTWKGFHKIIGKYWKTGLGEFYRSFYKQAFVRALQKLIPEIKSNDLIEGGAGVRAQACMKDGILMDDFYLIEDKCVVHVCNAPSPAATASLAIGDYVAGKAIEKLN